MVRLLIPESFSVARCAGCVLRLGTLLVLLLGCGSARALDVRLLIDISDSMDRADPDGRRQDAIRSVIDVLPDGSTAGVWSFGQRVNRLIPHATVDELWRTQARARASALESVALYSAIDAALAEATWDRGDATTPRHVILVSDGELEIAADAERNRAAEQALLNELLPELVAANVRVHAIDLAAGGNSNLLRLLADETGGRTITLRDPASLVASLTSVLGAIDDRDEIPVRPVFRASRASPQEPPVEAQEKVQQGPSVAAAKGSFVIDAGVGSMTLIAFKPQQAQFEVTDPNGQRFDRTRIPPGSRWHVGVDYEVLTLEEPATGRWLVNADGTQRVFVYGDLELSLNEPPPVFAPSDLHALDVLLRDRRSGQAVPARFARLLSWNARIEARSRRPRSVIELDAAGAATLYLSDIGAVDEGQLVVGVTGRTFERVIRHDFTVAHPLRADLVPGDGEDVPTRLWLAVDQPGLDLRTLRPMAAIRKPPGSPRWEPFVSEPGGLWSLPIEGIKGRREVTIDLTGRYYQGGDFSYRVGPIRMKLPIEGPQRLVFDAEGRLRRETVERASLATRDVVSDATDAATSSPAAAEGPVVLSADDPPPAARPAPAQIPLWFAGLGVVIAFGLAGLLWWLLGRRTIAVPMPWGGEALEAGEERLDGAVQPA
ncbi:MAG: vWA domain-containing protein [Pseudomonadota bacterium]